MSVFDTLLVGHLVGDFLFQTAWMANGKKRNLVPIIVHASVYALCILVFSKNTGMLSWVDYFIIWGSHLVIDSRKPTYWWMSKVMGVSSEGDKEAWLTIIVDQTFHLLVLYSLLF